MTEIVNPKPYTDPFDIIAEIQKNSLLTVLKSNSNYCKTGDMPEGSKELAEYWDKLISQITSDVDAMKAKFNPPPVTPAAIN